MFDQAPALCIRTVHPLFSELNNPIRMILRYVIQIVGYASPHVLGRVVFPKFKENDNRFRVIHKKLETHSPG